MVNIVTYERIVKDLAHSKIPVVYYNSGEAHATIVLENLFLSAKKTVRLLTGSFNKIVCGDEGKRFITALKKFLLHDGKIEVVMNRYSKNPSEYNLVLDILKQYSSIDLYSKNISVKYLDEDFDYKGFNVHFTVADSSMYRLEYDTEKFLAEFSFNGVERSKELESNFKDMFHRAIKLDLSTLKY